MPGIVVVGAQWGDEGKGKIVDVITPSVQIVVRYQGGNNTGHTVVNERGKFVLHTVPVGVFHEKTSIIERGVVVHPSSLVAEIDELENRGISVDKLLKINPFAHLVMPWHILKDLGTEASGTELKIGTTGKGIGPCYQEKMGRRHAIRVADLLNKSHFAARLEEVYNLKRRKLAHYTELPSLEEIRAEYLWARERILPFIADTGKIIRSILDKDGKVLFEGAQAFRLDVDHGTYPYTTSSNTTAAAAVMYTGIHPREVRMILGVVKALETRVGKGPFPTEFGGRESEIWCNDPLTTKEREDRNYPDVSTDEPNEFKRGIAMRRLANEYGATTGRARRCGRLDLPLLRYSLQELNADEIALTKLDLMGLCSEVQICTAYQGVGSDIDIFDYEKLGEQMPLYSEMESWGELNNVACRRDLPERAQEVLGLIERFTGRPITFVSTGPEPNQIINT